MPTTIASRNQPERRRPLVHETDVGWKPYIESWREHLDPVAQSAFYLLFSTYFEQNIDAIRKHVDAKHAHSQRAQPLHQLVGGDIRSGDGEYAPC